MLPELPDGLARLADVVVRGTVVGRGHLAGAGGPRGDLPPPEHDPAQAREAADEILSQARYQWSDDRSLVERIGQWVADQVGEITSPLGIGAGGLPVWVGWLVLGVLVAGVAYVVYRARAGWRRDRSIRGAAGGRVVVAAGEETIDWAAELARCEAEGRWREAVRARYRVLVAELARRRVIGDLVGRTAGELLADVRQAAPPAAPAFGAATAIFESAWYGGARVGPAEGDRLRALADEALAAAGRGPSRPRVPA